MSTIQGAVAEASVVDSTQPTLRAELARVSMNRRLAAAVQVSMLHGEDALPGYLQAGIAALKELCDGIVTKELMPLGVDVGDTVALRHERDGADKLRLFKLRSLVIEGPVDQVMAVLSPLRATDGEPSVRESRWPVDALCAAPAEAKTAT